MYKYHLGPYFAWKLDQSTAELQKVGQTFKTLNNQSQSGATWIENTSIVSGCTPYKNGKTNKPLKHCQWTYKDDHRSKVRS